MRLLISQTPVRLSMGGGGTDVPAYYTQRGGFWTSAAINQFVYLTVNIRNDNNYVIKYSTIAERAASIDEIQHDYFRTALQFLNFAKWRDPFFRTSGLEINVISDVTTRSGLGVSGAMAVGLLQILHQLKGDKSMGSQDLAEAAYHLEHDLVGSESTGKQDQYIAAFGGVTSFEIDMSGRVTVFPLELDRHTLAELEDNIVLFGTRIERVKTANDTLKSVTTDLEKTSAHEAHVHWNYLDKIREIGREQQEALLHQDPDAFGALLDEHWEVKKQYCGPADPAIDHAYTLAKRAGALGGKVIGASSTGAYMMFYCINGKEKLRAIMSDIRMIEIPWTFEFSGSRIIHIH